MVQDLWPGFVTIVGCMALNVHVWVLTEDPVPYVAFPFGIASEVVDSVNRKELINNFRTVVIGRYHVQHLWCCV